MSGRCKLAGDALTQAVLQLQHSLEVFHDILDLSKNVVQSSTQISDIFKLFPSRASQQCYMKWNKLHSMALFCPFLICFIQDST